MNRIPIASTSISSEEARAVFEQVQSGWISMGARVAEFEARSADALGARHAIAVNSGTAALHVALLALGVGPGDEVIVPCLSYASSANAVLYCGATPVFAEEDPLTLNVDAAEIAELITPRTRAIMTVDLKGMPVDYDAISALAAEHRVPVLADSAESFGARYRGAPVGAQADAHIFSFFANKSITTGEGGLVTTESDEVARVCRCLRNQGQSERYVHVMLGYNYRMTDIAAAFGIEQLRRLEAVLTDKERIAAAYTRAFADHPHIHPPHLPEYVSRHPWYMYCLRLDTHVDRDAVLGHLDEAGIDHRLSFPPIPLQPLYRERFGYRPGDFPGAEAIYAQMVDIPCWAGMGDAQVRRVIEAVRVGVAAALRERPARNRQAGRRSARIPDDLVRAEP